MDIPFDLIQELKNICKLNPRAEMCGLITSADEIIPIPNVASDPSNCFVFSCREYAKTLNKLKSQNKTIKAIYHTHPMTPPEPSEADLRYIRTSKIDSLIISKDSYRYITCQE